MSTLALAFDFTALTEFDFPGQELRNAVEKGTFIQSEGSELGNFPPAAAPLDDFPDELVHVMQKYQPVAIQSVTELVKRLQEDLTSLRTEVRSHESWYNRFKESLDAHNKQIGEISVDLRSEIEVRKRGEDKMSTVIVGIEKALTFLKGAAWVVMGILGFCLFFLIRWWFWS